MTMDRYDTDTATIEAPADRPSEEEFHRVCELDDLWAGEMEVFEVAGVKLLLVHTEDEELSAVQLICPHQNFEMSDGCLEGKILTCMRHLWEFDVVTGKGVNPDHAELALYPVKVVDGDVYVSVAGIKPKHSRP